jgi:hypothetical protein
MFRVAGAEAPGQFERHRGAGQMVVEIDRQVLPVPVAVHAASSDLSTV